MPNKVTVGVLLTCHNRRQLTLTCLESLVQQELDSSMELKIFLVDDKSSDGTADEVKKRYPFVDIIFGDGNLFWNRGMHLAFSRAASIGFDYYWWVNDDCIFYRNALKALLATYSHVNSIDVEGGHIVGGAMMDPDLAEYTYSGVRLYKSRIGRVTQVRVEPSESKIKELYALNGNCVLIPNNVKKIVGNIDPIFSHRFGDFDYCLRAKKRGCKIWLSPSALGVCKANGLEGTWKDPKLSVKSRVDNLFSNRSYPVKDYLIYTWRHRGFWWLASFLSPYVKLTMNILISIIRLR